MIKKFLPIIITFLLFSIFVQTLPALKSDIQAAIAAFEIGERARSEELLKTAVPDNPDEAATIVYYKAILSSDADLAKTMFQSLIDTYPKHALVQKALLELGKISLLDRDYASALAHFARITDPNLDEKHYWAAHTYYEKGDYTNAINSANQYFRLASGTARYEENHYLLADAYISLEQYNNAINTLKKLLSKPELIEDEQYLRYRYGYAAEMLDFRPEAISQYKQGYELNRFSQLAYMIEDRLFEMRDRFGSTIDLNFLYPYCAGPLPDIVLAEHNGSNSINNNSEPDTTNAVKNSTPKEIDPSQQQGIYLQAGRFSSQNNAIKLCDKIIKFNFIAQYYKSTQFQDVSWVVISGPFQTQLDAVNAKNLLRENGIDSFIIQK